MINIKRNSQRGFTLVELLVVIAIIGILATLLLLQLGVARQRARDAKRIADINQVRTALELYFDDNGSYPIAANYAALSVLAPKYLTLLPTDPLNTTTYHYNYAHNPVAAPVVQFHLYTELEQSARGALISDSDINSSLWAGGETIDASVAGAEACTSSAADDCIYDTGQSQ